MWLLLLNLSLVLCYCPAGNKLPGDSNLGKVEFNGMEVQTIVDPSDCPGGTGVVDRTDLIAAIRPGRPYSLWFQATHCDPLSAYARTAFAYLDWNGNGEYEPEELLGEQSVDARREPADIFFNGNAPAQSSFVGKTRMRVFVAEGFLTPEPCLTFNWGGVKEYSIEILPAIPQYCAAGPTVSGDSNLGKVEFKGEGGQNILDNTDCPGTLGIADRTYMTASLIPGRPFNLTFQATTCDQGWSRLTYAYIDWNMNGVYEPNELLGQDPVDGRMAPVDVTFLGTANFTSFGLTRMRIFVVESGFSPNPCLTFSYGGVKEFSIELLPSDPAAYCPAGNTVAGGSNLGAVDFLGELRTVIADGSNCPGGTGVRDFTRFSASVMPGGTYVLELDATTCNGQGFNRLTYAFIDYNSNGVYDPEELVGTVPVGPSSSPVDVSIRVSVPCSAKPGLTRMRVFVVEGGQITDPCLVFVNGGVKEFSIFILDQMDLPCLDPPHYCRTGNLLAGDSNLGTVEIDGIQGTAIRDKTNCPNTPGIKNLTDLSVSFQPGGAYSLYLEATTCGQGWARLAYAYIDFNANSEFEPTELVGSYAVDNRVTPVSITFDFVVPCIGNGALATKTRMRVYVVESGTSPDSCARFNYGSVKEYSIFIVDKPTNLCAASPHAEGTTNITLVNRYVSVA